MGIAADASTCRLMSLDTYWPSGEKPAITSLDRKRRSGIAMNSILIISKGGTLRLPTQNTCSLLPAGGPVFARAGAD